MADPKPKLTSADFPPEVLSLFDKYVHGSIDRRGFLKEASRFLIGAMTAAGALEALTPDFASAQVVPPADKRLSTAYVEFETSAQGYGKARGYLAKPAKASGKLPVVLVVHENRGLNPHIEDIARRLALDNHIALAPDALFPLGGYPGNEDAAREKFKELDPTKTREDFVGAARYARKLEGGNGKLGVVGFCYGGGMASFLATRLPDLDAAVSFYGSAPDLAEVPKIKAPLQIHLAATDERINAQWPDFEKALKAAKVRHEAHHYPGTQHGFNNDTTPRHDAAAAQLAWRRTLDFFGKHLKA
jgi:carboxymethylenebutenolidase